MYRLHSICQSGNSFKVAFCLNAMKQPWEPVFVDFFNGLSRDPAWREQTNEMGEVPVLEDGDKRVTQSAAIMLYLSRKHGRFAGRNEDEQQEVLRWLFFDNHKFTSFFATWRFMKSFAPTAPDPAIEQFLQVRIGNAFAVVEKHLEGRPYIVGDAPTLADMSMSAYLHYPKEEHGYDFAQTHPNIASWLARVRTVDGYADPYEVLPGERIMPRW